MAFNIKQPKQRKSKSYVYFEELGESYVNGNISYVRDEWNKLGIKDKFKFTSYMSGYLSREDYQLFQKRIIYRE